MDWSLRACGRRGHQTFAPDEPDLRKRLRVSTPAGEAWRCLRCGDFVLGAPKSSGPADRAPDVPRGQALRDLTIQRLLAVERLVRGVALIALGTVGIRFRESDDQLRAAFDADLALLRPVVNQIGWDVDDSDVLHGISRVFSFSPDELGWLIAAIFGYAALLLVESFGLWSGRRWGEYFSVVATSVFLPWEIYALTEKITVVRILLLLINIAAVAWLISTKRLCGVRGGYPAYHRLHSEQSLLTVERSALPAGNGQTGSTINDQGQIDDGAGDVRTGRRPRPVDDPGAARAGP